jgi:uncharacterized membrane protein YedE/YeeE
MLAIGKQYNHLVKTRRLEMTIDWNAFTPVTAIAGGLMIGLAAVVLVLFNGRILGVSGIVGGLFGVRSGDGGWRIAFLAGVLTVPVVLLLTGNLPQIQIDAGWGTIVLAGLLVGMGTRYGAGCTSGHGVCGLSRLSWRSVVATVLFVGAGMATVFVVRHYF